MPAGGEVLTDTQFAHDGVSEHADVAFHDVRVLASGSAPRPEPREPSYAEEIACRDGLPRRFRSSTLRACGAGRLALEQIPFARPSRPWANPPNVCTRMSSRLQKLSTVPLHELDAVMCIDLGGQQHVRAADPGRVRRQRSRRRRPPGSVLRCPSPSPYSDPWRHSGSSACSIERPRRARPLWRAPPTCRSVRSAAA